MFGNSCVQISITADKLADWMIHWIGTYQIGKFDNIQLLDFVAQLVRVLHLSARGPIVAFLVTAPERHPDLHSKFALFVTICNANDDT